MSIREWVSDYNEEALLADGFDSAIIGMCERIGIEPVVAYDREKCIDILMEEFKDDAEDDEDLYLTALEYFEYNVIGSYVGEYTPVFITIHDPDEIKNKFVSDENNYVWC